MASFYITLIELFRQGINDSSSVLSWLTTTIGTGTTFSIAFLSLFTFGGLMVYVSVAVVKWVVQ